MSRDLQCSICSLSIRGNYALVTCSYRHSEGGEHWEGQTVVCHGCTLHLGFPDLLRKMRPISDDK